MGSETSESFSYGRIVKMASLTLLAAAGLALTAPVMAMADSAQFNIASQPLPQALKAFAAQAHMQLLYEYGAVARAKGNAVIGDLDKHAALAQLLKNSGLEAVYSSDTAATIRRAGSTASPRSQATDQSQDSQSGSRLQLAQATPGQTAGASPVESNAEASTQQPSLQEVIVTAEKRNERLQDTPVPVTVIAAATLVDTNQTRLQDYYTSIPGLDLTLDNRGSPSVSIRGLSTTLYGNPTVGITLDDVPYGATTASAFQWAATDFDPNELSNVEVLRGPQGTLYGASSLGGLIKYETVDPTFDGNSGRVQGGVANVYNGSSVGYSVNGAANVVLGDTVAIRVSGFNRLDPGYITNILTDQANVNWQDADGGRFSALWRPSEDLSLKFSALIQDSKTYGAPYIDSISQFGDLQQSYIRGTGGYDRELQAYSLTLRYRLAGVDLTSVTGYGINTSSGSFDVSYLLGQLTEHQFGVDGDAWVEDNKTNKFSEELRASASLGKSVDWLLGVFYTDERTQLDGGHKAFDPVTGVEAGSWFDQYGPVTYREGAVFGDLTLHFTDRFDVQLGGRESQNRQSFSQVTDGIWNEVIVGQSSLVAIVPEATSKDNSFTYLVTPRLKLSPDLMLYARLASGYRPGGYNSAAIPGTVPLTFAPDTTQNYEIGSKGDLLGHAISFDASIYYIKWRDIQASVSSATFIGYTANVGQAKSQGAELSVQTAPWHGLTASAWGAWNDAQLTQALPPDSNVNGGAGDRLPYSAPFSCAFTLRQEVEFMPGVTGFAGATVSHVGDRDGEFLAGLGTVRQVYPGYTKTDLVAGARSGGWNTNIYVTNVSNQRGQLSGGQGTLNPVAFTYIQPRTIGLSVSKSF